MPPLLPPSPTRDACACYLLVAARNLGESREGGRNRRWGAAGGNGILPAPFSLFADACRSSRYLHPRFCACAEDSLLHQPRWRFVCTVGNCRTVRSSWAWPECVLRSGSCDNATRPRQPNGPKIAGPMRARARPGYQMRPILISFSKFCSITRILLLAYCKIDMPPSTRCGIRPPA
jgi:hypothetical protein